MSKIELIKQIIHERKEIEMDMTHPGVYVIVNLRNLKTYVGSASNIRTRTSKHINDLNASRHVNSYLQRSYDKEPSVFKIYLLEKFNKLDDLEELKNALLRKEQSWMDELESYDRDLGYNLLNVAGSHLGAKRSEESKKKLSESLRRTFRENPEKIKRGKDHHNYGKQLSEEEKNRLRNLAIGNVVKEETRRSISKTLSKPVMQFDLLGNFIRRWESSLIACKAEGYSSGHISECCRGIRKTHKKFIWRFEEDVRDNYTGEILNPLTTECVQV